MIIIWSLASAKSPGQAKFVGVAYFFVYMVVRARLKKEKEIEGHLLWANLLQIIHTWHWSLQRRIKKNKNKHSNAANNGLTGQA